MITTNRILSMLACALVLAAGCSKFDDSALWKAINENSAKIAALEEQCRQMNTDIKDLKVIVNALQTGDVITSVTPLADKTGYSITFKNAGTIVIKNGQDGSNGTNGKDGKDGKDGTDGKDAQTPVISVAQDTDGIYYWTLNGQWLLDANGNKIRVQGENGTDGKDGVDGKDGADGKNGADGLTPQFKIMDGYWYLSYDGETWEKLGKATGNNGSNGLDGLNGSDGDAFFKGVTMGDGYVIFMLNDGKDTLIKIPFYSDSVLMLTTTEEGMLHSLISDAQERTTVSLSVSGPLNSADIKFIRYHLTALESLDLSNTTISIIADNGFKGMKRLKVVKLPDSVLSIGSNAFTDCNLLTSIIAKRAVVESSAISDCPYIERLNIGGIEGTLVNYNMCVTLNGDIDGSITRGKVSVDSLFIGPSVVKIASEGLKNSYHIIFDNDAQLEVIETISNGKLKSIVLPKHLKSLGGFFFFDELSSVEFPVDCELEILNGFFMSGYGYKGITYYCPLVTKLVLPSNINSLHAGAFTGTSITELEILGRETYLSLESSTSAGALPDGLTKLTIHRRIPPVCIGTCVFGTGLNKKKCTLYVPAESISKYEADPNWNDFREILPIE